VVVLADQERLNEAPFAAAVKTTAKRLTTWKKRDRAELWKMLVMLDRIAGAMPSPGYRHTFSPEVSDSPRAP